MRPVKLEVRVGRASGVSSVRIRCGVVLMLLGIAGSAHAEARRALLVGVNDYRNPMDNLRGAVSDVNAMESILKVRYGFQDIVRLTDRDATRGQILEALRGLLLTRSEPGDVALVYYSGHGSLHKNTSSSEDDQMDETIVPHPWPRREDIRDKELGAILETAARRGVRAIAILDSCHSGSMGRGVGVYRHPKLLAPDGRPPIADPSRPDAAAAGALIVSAAQAHQIADEVRDENGHHGGAFTLALLKAMREAPVDESVAELFFRTRGILRNDNRRQEPAVDAGVERSREPLFGSGLRGTGVRLAVASSGLDGAAVVLEGGTAAGLSRGTILVRRAADGPKLTLRVVTADLTRSRATVMNGPIASIRAGQLYDVTKWALPLGVALRVHTPAARPHAEVLAAAARLAPLRTSARLAVIDDPTVVVPSHVLVAGPATWTLRGPDGRATRLGSSPDATLIEKALLGVGGIKGRAPPCDERPCLYIRLPPPSALVTTLTVGRATDDAIQAAVEEDAHYVLAGRMLAGRLEYAWIRAGVSAPAAPGEATSTSLLPARSRWIEGDAKHPEVTGRALEELLHKFARVRDWLQMPSPADSGRFPYRLAVGQTGTAGTIGAAEVRAGAMLTVNEHYDVYLRADTDRLKRADRLAHNIYVLALDGTGAIKVLFPHGQSIGPTETLYPAIEGEWPALIRIGKSGFKVGCPVGAEVLILLRSAEALPNLQDIEQDGATRSERPGATTGLERLLLSVGKRSRSIEPDPLAATEPEWGIERLELRSREGVSPCRPPALD